VMVACPLEGLVIRSKIDSNFCAVLYEHALSDIYHLRLNMSTQESGHTHT
jgi:hypothetical protein